MEKIKNEALLDQSKPPGYVSYLRDEKILAIKCRVY
jgi:hypothetical protein